MAKTRFLDVVMTECNPDKDAAFNKWYNEVHIPMFLKYKGLKKVTRYKMMNAAGKKSQYLAVYEYDTRESLAALPQSPEFKEAMAEMQKTWGGKGFEIKLAANWEPIKTWEK